MTIKEANLHKTVEAVRARCAGIVPLHAKLEDWMVDVFQGGQLTKWLERWGSPLNVHSDEPFRRNIAKLANTAVERHVDFDVYFARKANECLTFVDAVREIGCGVDVASEPELAQALSRDVTPCKIACTAAIKSESLIRLCVSRGVLIVVDNLDELLTVQMVANNLKREAVIALRVSGFLHNGEKLFSRFGFDASELGGLIRRLATNRNSEIRMLNLAGIHFHLDGYCPNQRISALRETLRLVDQCRTLGLSPQFIDMGGGIPMSYLENEIQWETFWTEHRSSLLGAREPITYRNHALGLTVVDQSIHGKPNTYPYCQSPVQSEWLAQILDARHEERTIAAAFVDRGIQLRCEPGRSLLDGCGITVARVEFRKRHQNGDWLIGLSMNRTQCRTSSDDFLVDPIVICGDRSPIREDLNSHSMTGYFVGAYCTESEVLSLRRLRFPFGIAVGDLVVFPNTAGYLMHFLESRSHQFPLGKNVFVDDLTRACIQIDAIDLPGKAVE